MENKYQNGVNVNSLHQRKGLHYSNSSSIPRLPPIFQNDIPTSCNSSPILQKRKQIGRAARDFDIDSSQPKSTLLPKLERSNFEANSVFYKTAKKDGSKSLLTDLSPRYADTIERKPILASDSNFNFISKQDTSISSTILGMRRKRKDRLLSYKCSPNTVIDDDISQLEQRVGFDAISTSTTASVKDMKGRLIHSGDVYNEGVSSLITMIDEDEKSEHKTTKDSEKDSEDDSSTKKPSRSTELRKRFLKALDMHFFNEFVNMKLGRRMAICEELEKNISGDGKTSLTGLREHLRLQDVLDSWVL